MAGIPKRTETFFRLSPAADGKAQCFAVRRGDFKERADVIYFASSSRLAATKFPLSTVGAHFHVRDGDHNQLPSDEIRSVADGIRYLRSQDLCDGEITAKDAIYISKEYYSKIQRSHIKPRSLLFSIMASIGNSAIVPDDFPPATANRAVGILVPKTENNFLTWYLFYLFSTNLGTELYTRIKKGGLQQRTNLADIDSLEFPLPKESIQQKLVTAMDAAHGKWRSKLAEADALLSGLDDFLLETLGLTKPPNNNQKVFAVRLRDIGKRADPYSNQSRFRKLFTDLHKSKYRVAQFSELADRIFSGITPLAKGDAYVIPPAGVRFIRSGEITDDGEVTPLSTSLSLKTRCCKRNWPSAPRNFSVWK